MRASSLYVSEDHPERIPGAHIRETYLLKTALVAGHQAKYVLFDSWFSNPKQILSVPVKVGQDKTGKNGIDARIVCVRDCNKHKDWIAIICTDMSLSEQDIIRIYGHRWDIEVFFKWIKQNIVVKTLWGYSENAVRTHLWVAIIGK